MTSFYIRPLQCLHHTDRRERMQGAAEQQQQNSQTGIPRPLPMAHHTSGESSEPCDSVLRTITISVEGANVAAGCMVHKINTQSLTNIIKIIIESVDSTSI